MTRIQLWVWLFVMGVGMSPISAAAQSAVPTSFTIDTQGRLTCNGVAEDACAYYDELKTPQGVFYLVQGSYSRHPTPSDIPRSTADFINVYFALFCERSGNTLAPTLDLLEGRERVSDIHLYDLDADGINEIIVTGIFDSRSSYASVYRVDKGRPVLIFTRRANTPNTDFELRKGVPTLTLQQRNKARDLSKSSSYEEIFSWNGQGFAQSQ